METNIPKPPPPIIHNTQESRLSFGQESIWFLQQLSPESIDYNVCRVYKFDGQFSREAMEQAINDVICRHEQLRALFPSVDGLPTLQIHPFISQKIHYEDLSQTPVMELPEYYKSEVIKIAESSYNLRQGPMFRPAIFRLNPETHILVLCLHHIISDGITIEILKSDILRCYAARVQQQEPDLPKLSLTYRDYATWQRTWLTDDMLVGSTKYWKEVLSGDLPVIEMPRDYPSGKKTYLSGLRKFFSIPPEVESRIRQLCKEQGYTSFQIYLAALAILIMRYTGQEDMIIGCPFSNRKLAELDDIIGFFINTLPLRINLAGNPTVSTLLFRIKNVVEDARTWQDVPFDKIVKEINPARDLSRSPLFQVGINKHKISSILEKIDIGNLKMSEVLFDWKPAPFDISLEFVIKDGSLQPYFLYKPDLFHKNTIERFITHYLNILSNLLTNPEKQLSGLSMLSEEEHNRIIYEWNRTEADFPQASLHELITQQVRKTPEKIAIITKSGTLTYGEMEIKSNRLANYILQKEIGPGSIVAVFLARTENIILCPLAIMKAGAAYLGLEPAYPPERIRYILDEVKPVAVITTSDLKGLLPNDTPLLILDEEAAQIESCPTTDPPIKTSADDQLYITYTSGSTGKPKGSINIHRGAVNAITHARRLFELGESDCLVEYTSIAFDAFTYWVFNLLPNGATLCLMDDTQMRDPEAILRSILSYGATIISCVPSMLRKLSETALSYGLQSKKLRLIIALGEPLFRKDVELAREAFGANIRVFNLYGPSECSMIHTSFQVPPNEYLIADSIPIGRPMDNTRAYVLDKDLLPVPAGVIGELFVSGINVGKGYLSQPELTSEKFLMDPFNPGERMYRTGDLVRQDQSGVLSFVGRRDNQVKIRGLRVEPDEIAMVIREVPGVIDAVVLHQFQGSEDTLRAFICLSSDEGEQAISRIREFLPTRLPYYMLPHAYTILPELPVTSSGKPDRQLLLSLPLDVKPQAVVEPRTDIERKMLGIWQSVLGKKNIGTTDNFFALGGHSLLGVTLIARLEKEFCVSIPLFLLFREGTIGSLCRYISDTNAVLNYPGILKFGQVTKGPRIYILSPNKPVSKLVELLSQSYPVFGVYPYKGDTETYLGSVQQTAEYYYQCLQNFDSEGPYNLLGHSAAGAYALELARLLLVNGKQVQFVGLLDTYPPGFKEKYDSRKFYAYVYRKFISIDFRGKLQYLAHIIKLRFKQLSTRWRFRTIKLRHEKFGKALEGIDLLYKEYKMDDYPGDVVIFRALMQKAFVDRDNMEGWPDFIKGHLEFIPIGGDHISFLDEPNVQDLVSAIQNKLNQNQ